jgi:hypothetical protein
MSATVAAAMATGDEPRLDDVEEHVAVGPAREYLGLTPFEHPDEGLLRRVVELVEVAGGVQADSEFG